MVPAANPAPAVAPTPAPCPPADPHLHLFVVMWVHTCCCLHCPCCRALGGSSHCCCCCCHTAVVVAATNAAAPAWLHPPAHLCLHLHLPALIHAHRSLPSLLVRTHLHWPLLICAHWLSLAPVLLLVPTFPSVCLLIRACSHPFMPVIATLVLLIIAALMGHPMVSVSNRWLVYTL